MFEVFKTGQKLPSRQVGGPEKTASRADSVFAILAK